MVSNHSRPLASLYRFSLTLLLITISALTPTERAVEAFDLLKKASSHLLDEDKRKTLDETVMDARLMVLKELNLPFSQRTMTHD